MQMHEIKKTAFFGLLWRGGNQIFKQIILFFVKIFLAKLLIPDEFGLAAMAFILISIFNLLNSIGIGPAFIREDKFNRKRAENTLFYLGLIPNILIALFTFFLAPVASAYFFSPANANYLTLIWMIRAVALTRIFKIFSTVSLNALLKDLKFDKITISNVAGTIVYAITSIVLALMGYGAWSIVIAIILESFVIELFLFIFYPIMPKLIFDFKIAKDYIIFGYNYLVASIISIIVRNGDDVLIGHFVGVAGLGLYSLAQHIGGLVLNSITGVVNQVMFPLYCKLKNDKEVYCKSFIEVFEISTLFTIPAVFGIFALAKDFINVFLTPSWMPMLGSLYILLIASFFNNISTLTNPIFLSANKPEIIKYNRMYQFVFYLILIYPLTKYYGLIGASIVMLVFALVSITHFFLEMHKVMKLDYFALFKAIFTRLFGSFFMLFIIYLSSFLVDGLFIFFVKIFFGVLSYFSIMYFIDRKSVMKIVGLINLRFLR